VFVQGVVCLFRELCVCSGSCVFVQGVVCSRESCVFKGELCVQGRVVCSGGFCSNKYCSNAKRPHGLLFSCTMDFADFASGRFASRKAPPYGSLATTRNNTDKKQEHNNGSSPFFRQSTLNGTPDHHSDSTFEQECRLMNKGGCNAGDVVMRSADEQRLLCCDRKAARAGARGGMTREGAFLPPYQDVSRMAYERYPYGHGYMGNRWVPGGRGPYGFPYNGAYSGAYSGGGYPPTWAGPRQPVWPFPFGNRRYLGAKKRRGDTRDWSTWNKRECPTSHPRCVDNDNYGEGRCCRYETDDPSDKSAQCTKMRCRCDSRHAHNGKCLN
jgi:hypothetical protein